MGRKRGVRDADWVGGGTWVGLARFDLVCPMVGTGLGVVLVVETVWGLRWLCRLASLMKLRSFVPCALSNVK